MSERPSHRGGYSKSSAEPKRWHIEAKSSDGQAVVLGRYETEAQAERDLEMILSQGFYTKAKIIKSAAPPAAPPTEPPAAS